jgi:indole-3-glycerol phosphate synthase
VSAAGRSQPVGVLGRIVETTVQEVAQRKREMPPEALRERVEERLAVGDVRPFFDVLERPGLSVIAEHKRRSPSAGAIREDLSLEDVVGAYERGGAAALSVLTEAQSFGGTLSDLTRARAASTLPILRKDFIVDSYQLAEALAFGADAVLLIVAALGASELARLHEEAVALGLVALVEVHSVEEVEPARAAGARVIGINNRDLTTLRVDSGTTYSLLPELPEDVVTVAESGFRHRRELDELSAAGLDAVLIGETLMRSPDLEAACRRLTAPD